MTTVFAQFMMLGALALQAPEEISAIRTNDEARDDYLARAVIWRDPGPISPEDVLEGPIGRFQLGYHDANRPEGFPCTFQHAGKHLGGMTRKFTCQTEDGTSLRVKYYDGEGGNREVFGSVASTRLMWILGFDADAVYPVTVNCLDCPEDPWTGEGQTASRVFIGTVEPHYEGTLILSKDDADQGWTFEELDEAVRALPLGGLRGLKRMHFDALTLLGVLVQHGDRKRSQQRLVCRGEIDFDAGDVHRVAPTRDSEWGVPVLFERPGIRSCSESVVTVQDVGATFGGAGIATAPTKAKMNLQEWGDHDVFRDAPFRHTPPRDTHCKGNISISFTASGGQGFPPISEEGRLFLLQQLKRLTRDHLVALFTAARVEALGDENRFEDPETGKVYSGVDAWVHAFQRKVREIEETRCRAF